MRRYLLFVSCVFVVAACVLYLSTNQRIKKQMAIFGKDSLFEAAAGVDITAHTPSGTGATGGAWAYVFNADGMASVAGGGFGSSDHNLGNTCYQTGAQSSGGDYVQVTVSLTSGAYGGPCLISDPTVGGGSGYILSQIGSSGALELDKYTGVSGGQASSTTLATYGGVPANTPTVLRLERSISGGAAVLTPYVNGTALAPFTDSSTPFLGPLYGGINAYAPVGQTNNFAAFEAGTLVVPPANLIAPNNAGYVYSGRWAVAPTVATTICNGATCEFECTGDPISLNFDDSTVVTTGVGARPVVAYWVDGFGPTRVAMPAGGVVPLTIPHSSSAHRVKFTTDIDSCYTETGPNNWTSQTQATKFSGVALAVGATLLPISANVGSIEFVGDSITAGLRVLYTGTNGNQADAVELSWALGVASDLGLTPIVNGHGGLGLTMPSTDGTPVVASSFGSVYSGVAWNPAVKPLAAWIYLGTNDTGGFSQAQYQAVLTAMRSAYPSAILFAVVPYQVTDGRKTTIQAAVTAQADSSVVYLDYSAAFTSGDLTDGTHFNIGGAAKMRARASSDILAALMSRGVKYQTLNVVSPAITDVRLGRIYGPNSAMTGTLAVPTAAQVLAGVAVDATTGTVVLPTASQVIIGIGFGAAAATIGNVTLPAASAVQAGTLFGPSLSLDGTLAGGGSSVTDTSVQADVAAALAALGLTSTRVAKLDYLDLAVSTVATAGGSLTPATVVSVASAASFVVSFATSQAPPPGNLLGSLCCLSSTALGSPKVPISSAAIVAGQPTQLTLGFASPPWLAPTAGVNLLIG